jgi:type I restriction enzyme S subunit
MNTELPPSWLMTDIRSFALDIRPGFARQPNESNEGCRQLRMPSISRSGFIDYTVSKFVDASDEEKAKYSVRKGDVIFNNTNSPELVGNAAVFEDETECVLSNHMTRIRVDERIVFPPYLAAVLHRYWRTGQTQRRSKQWINQAAIDIGTLSRFRIPLPPLSEQQRIVDILQEAEEIRRLRAQAEAKTAELIPALFHFAFSHSMGSTNKAKMIRLEEIADVQGGIQVTKSRDNAPLKVPYLRVANVQRDALDLAEMKEIGLTEAELERTRLLKGDILVVEGHGNPDELGRAAIWTGEIDPCTHQNHLIRVRCKPGTDPAYVLSMLNGALGRRHFLTAGNTTSGLNTISTNIVRNFRMPVPTGKAMAEFATLREATLGLIGLEARKMNIVAGKLTVSLSAHAFTGKLTEAWREARPKLLAKESRKRDDELAMAAGEEVMVNFSLADPDEERELFQLPTGFNKEQVRLWFEMKRLNLKKELPRYFTAEHLAEQMKGPLHRHSQAIESHLTVFAVRGIVIPVSRAREAVPGKPFAASYRLPMNEEGAPPEQRDDVKAERMKHQRTSAAGKR